MARIMITTERDDGVEPAVLMEERVLPEHFESEHFSAQLVERVGWAVVDAHTAQAPPKARRKDAGREP
jgi:hypothetical protein